MCPDPSRTAVYRASDEVANAEWREDLEAAADRLDLDTAARSRAMDVFLSALPDSERSKRATLAAAVYVGALVAGDQRSQGEVAEAVGVSRLSVQSRWKEVLEAAGLEAPSW
jgi:transcription initiation factor TFIIIB Brf1 subunit/transcription initiation factor TFIIB